MMGATQRWMIAIIFGLAVVAVTTTASALDAVIEVSDADRLSANFTREAATVEEGQVRIEVKALRKEERTEGGNPDCRHPFRENCARLNLIGQRVIGVEEVKGTVIELVTSYGIAENAEIGFIVPGYIESMELDNGDSFTNEDLGDLTLYAKFKHAVSDNIALGGGLELFVPPWNGLDDKTRTAPDQEVVDANGDTEFSVDSIARRNRTGFSTGELGLNPFVSTRYQSGRLALGAHAGYTFYTGDEIEEVFNYSASMIVRGSDSYALRVEFNGRVWDEFGEKWHDAVVMPGIDYALSDNIVIRPTGLANITKTAFDWGIGLGVAATF